MVELDVFFNVSKPTIKKWIKEAKIDKDIKYIDPLELNYLVNKGNKYLKRVTKLCLKEGIEYPFFEYKIDKNKNTRADVCWVDKKLILEIEGGISKKDSEAHGKLSEKFQNATVENWHKMLKELERYIKKIEVKDGGWHRSLGGYLKDMEKHSHAAMCGYRVFRTATWNIEKTISNYIVPAIKGEHNANL